MRHPKKIESCFVGGGSKCKQCLLLLFVLYNTTKYALAKQMWSTIRQVKTISWQFVTFMWWLICMI